MKTKLLTLFVLIFILSGTLSAQNWREIKTVEDICEAYPQQMQTMLNQFNLDYKGLEKVKSANKSGKLVEACTELA